MAVQGAQSGTETLQDANFLLRKTSNLYLSNEMSDISLLVKSQQGTWKKLPTHRLILAACSLYWKALLQGQFNVASDHEIKVEHADEDVMKEVLRFVYTGTVKLNAENVAPVMKAAAQEQLEGLLELCKTYISKNKNFKLCCNVFNMKSIDDEIDEIKMECKNYVLERGESLTTNPATLAKLPQGTMIQLVSSTAFKAEEHKVFRMVQEWCAAHAKDRDCKEEMRGLYAPFELLVRYPLLHPRHLQTLVRASGLVREELLLDAWEVQRGLRTDSHADWTQPRLETLSWHVSWSEVKNHGPNFHSIIQHYKKHPFFLWLEPGTEKDSEAYLSVYFYLNDMAHIENDCGLKVSWSLSLQNQMDPDDNKSGRFEYTFEKIEGWGYSHFIALDELEESDGHQSAFLDKGVMTFEVQILHLEVVELPVELR